MRADLKRWWPELLWTAVFATIAVFDHHGGLFLALFCTGVAAAGWGMGRRHKLTPLHQKVDGITAGVREILDDVRAREDVQDDEPARPALTLVRTPVR